MFPSWSSGRRNYYGNSLHQERQKKGEREDERGGGNADGGRSGEDGETEIKSRKDFPSHFTVNWVYEGTEWTSVNLEPLQLSSESLFHS